MDGSRRWWGAAGAIGMGGSERPTLPHVGAMPPAAESSDNTPMRSMPLPALVLLAAGPAAAQDVQTAIAGRALHPGEVVRVEVRCDCAAQPRLTMLGQTVSLLRSADGAWQGLAGIDLDVVPGRYPLVVEVPGSQPPEVRSMTFEVAPKQFSTRNLRVAGQFVNPPADVADRIVQEAALLDRTFRAASPASALRPFLLPLSTRPSQNFGQRSVFNGQPRSPHAGIDFASPEGTPIAAPAAGVVVVARDLYFTGNTVVVDHGAGLYSLYGHLSAIHVRENEPVAAGSPLGLVGATGRVTGPHLHWAVRLNGARVDPLSLVAATGAATPLPITAAE